MKPRAKPRHRPRRAPASPIFAWTGAVLALAPLSMLFWAVSATSLVGYS